MSKLKSAVIGLVMASVASAATAEDCLVEEAAQAALNREIALIKATATDVDETFNGTDGCIDSSIFDDFDLSSLIPDLAGMLTSLSTSFITDAISSAKSKLCKAVNDQISDTVGSAKSAVTDFDSGLSSELKDALDNGWEDVSL